MKQIRHFSAVPLYTALALLLCFGSCQSSDQPKAGEGASVASLPLTAQIGETSSRVSMSDTYGGAFSCYWNGDKFSVYHPYVLSGVVQSITTGLEFGTSATSGTSATFSYTGSGTYRYNPGNLLYVFSKGTSGGYTSSITTGGVSTLTAPTLASQNGTLSDCATYDALYGSASVDYNTGKPGSLAMHHLFGMLNLHLTNSSFSTSYPVTVSLTSSAANILPGNSGSATLAADGSTLTPSGSGRWGTSWSATISPTSAGVVDVYLMTWPFSSISGTFTVSCSDGTGNTYTARTITLSGFSLAAAQLKSQPLAITNAPAVNTTYSNLYAWDATDSQPVTVNTKPTNANTTPVASSTTDYSSRALYACKNCPNYNEISWYLKAGCYWDDGNQGAKGGNTTSYTMANGATTKAGLWLKKKSVIGSSFSSTASSGVTNATTSNGYFTLLSSLTASAISALNLSTNYFFLPAAGYTILTGAFDLGGTYGLYWSSTPGSVTSTAYNLGFDSSGADLVDTTRTNGFCLWQAQ